MKTKSDKITKIEQWWGNRPGHLDEIERDFLIDLLDEISPSYCLETGTSTGRSSATILCFAEPKKHISIELNLDGVIGGSSRSHIQNMMTEFSNFRCIEGDSRLILNREFFENEYPNGVDFYFVDGGHTFEVCLSDMELVWPYINEGGIMIVDDYRSGPPGGCHIQSVDDAVHKFAYKHSLTFARWHGNGKGCATFRK